MDDERFSVDGARQAAGRDDLGGWVKRFLASPGSDNETLAHTLADRHESWIGPVQLPLGRLQRLAGPPGDPVLCPVDEEYWDDRVDDMERRMHVALTRRLALVATVSESARTWPRRSRPRLGGTR